MLIIPSYSQGDPRWRSLPLGTTGGTIGSIGCLVTVIASCLARYGITETPATVVAKLKAVGGFMPSGDLIWTALPKAWPGVHFVWRQYTTLEPPSYANRRDMVSSAAQVHRLNAIGQPVPLNVRLANGMTHWFAAYDGPMGDPTVMDPNGGWRGAFSARQGEFARGVYGYAVLVGDTAFVPPWSQDVRDAHAAFKAAEIAAGRNVQTYAREILGDLIS